MTAANRTIALDQPKSLAGPGRSTPLLALASTVTVRVQSRPLTYFFDRHGESVAHFIFLPQDFGFFFYIKF